VISRAVVSAPTVRKVVMRFDLVIESAKIRRADEKQRGKNALDGRNNGARKIECGLWFLTGVVYTIDRPLTDPSPTSPIATPLAGEGNPRHIHTVPASGENRRGMDSFFCVVSAEWTMVLRVLCWSMAKKKRESDASLSLQAKKQASRSNAQNQRPDMAPKPPSAAATPNSEGSAKPEISGGAPSNLSAYAAPPNPPTSSPLRPGRSPWGVIKKLGMVLALTGGLAGLWTIGYDRGLREGMIRVVGLEQQITLLKQETAIRATGFEDEITRLKQEVARLDREKQALRDQWETKHKEAQEQWATEKKEFVKQWHADFKKLGGQWESDIKRLIAQTNSDHLRIGRLNIERIQARQTLAQHNIPVNTNSGPAVSLPKSLPTDPLYEHVIIEARRRVETPQQMEEAMKQFRIGLTNFSPSFNFTNATIRDSKRGNICHALATDLEGYEANEFPFRIVPQSYKTFELHHTTNGIVYIFGMVDEVTAREISPVPTDRAIVLYPKPFATNTVLVRILLQGQISAFAEDTEQGAIMMNLERRPANLRLKNHSRRQ
jgi:hypothetical protein